MKSCSILVTYKGPNFWPNFTNTWPGRGLLRKFLRACKERPGLQTQTHCHWIRHCFFHCRCLRFVPIEASMVSTWLFGPIAMRYRTLRLSPGWCAKCNTEPSMVCFHQVRMDFTLWAPILISLSCAKNWRFGTFFRSARAVSWQQKNWQTLHCAWNIWQFSLAGFKSMCFQRLSELQKVPCGQNRQFLTLTRVPLLCCVVHKWHSRKMRGCNWPVSNTVAEWNIWQSRITVGK